MSDVRRLVLDVLKPHDPGIVAFTEHLADEPSVGGVRTRLLERDQEVDTCEVTVEGPGLDRAAVVAAIEAFGAAVHSVDEVVCGELSRERP